MGRLDAGVGSRKTDVNTGDRSPPTRQTKKSTNETDKGQLDTGDDDRKTSVSTGDRSPPTRPTTGQFDTGDSDMKTDVSTGDRSPPTRPTTGQFDTGDSDMKTDISTGDRSPPTRQTKVNSTLGMTTGRLASARATRVHQRDRRQANSTPGTTTKENRKRSASGKFVNIRGHVTGFSRVTTQFATRLERLSLVSMARTKQTAGRTTSGYAKPAQLSGCKRRRSSSTDILSLRSSSPLSSCPPSPELQPTTISKESNTFCYLCHDGSRTVVCSNSACPRVVCDVCIDIPESIATRLGTHEISFKCPACHEKEERAAHSKPMPYFVSQARYSMLLLKHMKAFTQIVQGKSVPVCSTPTFVKGICERASKSQVCGGPILILHFVCTGLNTRGGVPRLLNAALEEYFTEATLRYLEVVFDFGTRRKLSCWQAEAQRLAATIGEVTFQQKIIFISVHSELTHGDLFAGKDEGGDDVAVLPKEFMDYLFSGQSSAPRQRSYYVYAVVWSAGRIPTVHLQLQGIAN
ncbi:hypothetical protein EDD17DRAFT_1763295 [Pisolithus thermaeus]|nr:hypothetical protein EDD17DRAFT_1763295 [Pisolithus thermaeus]